MEDESVRITGHRTRPRQLLFALVTGIVVTVVFGPMAFLSTAGGHGTYVPVALFFPVALLLAIKLTAISNGVLYLAAAQWPLYGVAIGLAAGQGRQKAAIICLTVMHATLVVACFLLDRGRQFL